MDEELKNTIGNTKIDVSVLRGLVITEAVNIDSHIGAIITNYFVLSDKHSSFSTMVLSDPFFSFGMKINILKRIINKLGLKVYDRFKDDLHRANELRNRFAHSMMFGFEGDLIYPAGEKPMKIKKAREMYNEFMLIYPKIVEELDNIFWILIGKPNPFKKQGDTKNPEVMNVNINVTKIEPQKEVIIPIKVKTTNSKEQSVNVVVNSESDNKPKKVKV
jgi:hypothetical protein